MLSGLIPLDGVAKRPMIGEPVLAPANGQASRFQQGMQHQSHHNVVEVEFWVDQQVKSENYPQNPTPHPCVQRTHAEVLPTV